MSTRDLQRIQVSTKLKSQYSKTVGISCTTCTVVHAQLIWLLESKGNVLQFYTKNLFLLESQYILSTPT